MRKRKYLPVAIATTAHGGVEAVGFRWKHWARNSHILRYRQRPHQQKAGSKILEAMQKEGIIKMDKKTELGGVVTGRRGLTGARFLRPNATL